MWWRDAVVYQIYPRSFQDSDGDGIGDLRGIERRLDHLAWLGVDALWLCPIYPSPLADFGYDIADYVGIDPVFGSLSDFDSLVTAAHDRGLKLLMDLVPSHTSIEHAWFRDHPERYIWSPVDGPPNNWIASFGGPAWSRDPHGRGWYLHSFYPEQPDLDWRNPEVHAAMTDVMRFWRGRGVDGFRVDAIDRMLKDGELRDDPPADVPFALPIANEQYASLAHVNSTNAPGIQDAIGVLRAAAGSDLLVGEVFQSTADSIPYLEHLDLVFAFELLFSPWDADRLRAAIEAAAGLVRGEVPAAAWVMSNHDFTRASTRFGHANERVVAMLELTLPGAAFVYQGEEIGLADGPGHNPPYDRAGRDGPRHPMQWEPGRAGGFTTGEPWLSPVDPEERNVAAQLDDPGSLLQLYKRLVALRRTLGRGIRFLDSVPGTLVYERGDDHVVALNVTGDERPAPPHGQVVLATGATGPALAPHSGVVARQHN